MNAELTALVREALEMYMRIKADVEPVAGKPGDAKPMLHLVTTAGAHRVAVVMVENVHPTDVIIESITHLGGSDALDAVVWLFDGFSKPVTPAQRPPRRGAFQAEHDADPAGSGVTECLLAQARHRDGSTAWATVAYTHDETGAVVYEQPAYLDHAQIGDVPRMLQMGMLLQEAVRYRASN